MVKHSTSQDQHGAFSQPAVVKPSLTANTGDHVGFGSNSNSSVAESENEEDIVFQMRGLRGLGGVRKSVATRQLARQEEDSGGAKANSVVSNIHRYNQSFD
jgi:hypothetical protein